MDENNDFDQNQEEEGPIDTDFNQKNEEEHDADPKEEAISSPRLGFLPKLVLDPKVDPHVDLIKVMFNQALNHSDDPENWLYDSIYSLFSLLAFETLSQEYQRIASTDACILLAVKFSEVMQSLHTKAYFQSKFIDLLPDRVLPEQVLAKLHALSNCKLNKRFNTLSSQQANIGEDEKQQQFRLANLGQKVFNIRYIFEIII